MNKLISLAELVPDQKISQHEFIFDFENNKSKIARLFEGISSGTIINDEDAIKLLYEKSSSEESLNKLKSRLYDRMLNSLLFIDLNKPKYSDQIQAAKSCYKNYTIIRYLIANKKRELAIDLAKKTYKISKTWEFTDINFLIAGVLSTHYAMFELNRKNYKKYKELRKHYSYIMEAELEAEELTSQLNFQLVNSSLGLSQSDISVYKSELSSLEARLEKIPTRRYLVLLSVFKANFYLETSEYDKVIQACSYALSSIKDENKLTFATYSGLTTRLGIAKFLIRKYNEADELFRELLGKCQPTQVNWYNTQHLRFSLMITTNKYTDSFEILSKVINQEKFSKTHPLLIQLFKIKEAYIHFLVELGKINLEESDEKPLRKFRLNRFLNDVPTYSKDKRGVNISILIIQMLLLVQNKKHGQIIDKLDALNMYSHRYLRSDNTFRSNCFIKMLTKLPDADYHPIRWQRYVEKYRKRLDEHPFELSYHNLDLEVIPFETLYDLVVEMLEKQKGVVRS